MTYEEVKKELKEQDLDIEFCSVFESVISKKLLLMFKETDIIHSTASLLMILFKELRGTDRYEYWLNVFRYYNYPPFARPEKISEWMKK